MTIPTVQVTGGAIQGYPSPHGDVTVYKGVPYAAPPVGRNRFRPPQPMVPWSGVKLCDKQAPICPQATPDPRDLDEFKDFAQSEDCLYLNVYIPEVAQKRATEGNPFPMFMWLHGGAKWKFPRVFRFACSSAQANSRSGEAQSSGFITLGGRPKILL